jgi:hypothetical protein
MVSVRSFHIQYPDQIDLASVMRSLWYRTGACSVSGSRIGACPDLSPPGSNTAPKFGQASSCASAHAAKLKVDTMIDRTHACLHV